MILLDTNYLIRALVPGTCEADQIERWIEGDETLCTTTIAWYEFLCGPADAEGVTVLRSLIDERIFPFTADQSAEAARLFNAAGRQRHLRVDSMIAATAIVVNASLATGNAGDFSAFTEHGLMLV